GQGGGSVLAKEFEAPLLAQFPLLAREGSGLYKPENLKNSSNPENEMSAHSSDDDLAVADPLEWHNSPYRPYFQVLSSSLARAIAVHQASTSDLMSEDLQTR
ncbi:MAG: hypothetical protein ACKO6M_01370, partial [Bacteroidota bacterium]